MDVRPHIGEEAEMTVQTEITRRNHSRAVRFFWCFLIGATAVSLIGNVVHAVLPYVPRVVIEIGAAAVPPIGLLAAVHGIALAIQCGGDGQGLLLGGRCRRSNRRGGVRSELSRLARPDASYRIQHYNGMGFSHDHRHRGCSQHPDAGCTGGQACYVDPAHCDHIGQCRGPRSVDRSAGRHPHRVQKPS